MHFSIQFLTKGQVWRGILLCYIIIQIPGTIAWCHLDLSLWMKFCFSVHTTLQNERKHPSSVCSVKLMSFPLAPVLQEGERSERGERARSERPNTSFSMRRWFSSDSCWSVVSCVKPSMVIQSVAAASLRLQFKKSAIVPIMFTTQHERKLKLRVFTGPKNASQDGW